jgi:parallel beta-helix repeat protein
MNGQGLVITGSQQNFILANEVHKNTNEGISGGNQEWNTYRHNKLGLNGWNIWIDGGYHDIDISNSVMGKPIVYIFNSTDIYYADMTPGALMVVNCTGTLYNISMGYGDPLVLYQCDQMLVNMSYLHDISHPFGGLVIYQSTDVTVRNTFIENCTDQGLYVEGSTGIIRDCAMYYNDIYCHNSVFDTNDVDFFNGGIVYEDTPASTGCEIINNEMWRGGTGISLTNVKDVLVRDNTIDDMSTGIQVSGCAYPIDIIFNNVSNCSTGFSIQNSWINGFNWNILTNNAKDLNVGGLYNHTINANTVNGRTIYYYYMLNDTVVTHTDAAAIYLIDCWNLTVDASNISYGDGLVIFASDNITVIDTSIYSTAIGIGAQDIAFLTIDNVDITDTSQGISASNVEFIEINNVTIEDTTTHGIYLGEGVLKALVSSVNVSASTYSIYIEGGSSTSNISDSFVFDSTFGVYLDNTAGNEIYHTAIYSCDYGVYFDLSPGNYITESSINSNDYGLYFDHSYRNTVNQNNIYGNSIYGAYAIDNDEVFVNCQYNWWDHGSGPSPTGSGDNVTDWIDFGNWLGGAKAFSLSSGMLPIIGRKEFETLDYQVNVLGTAPETLDWDMNTDADWLSITQDGRLVGKPRHDDVGTWSVELLFWNEAGSGTVSFELTVEPAPYYRLVEIEGADIVLQSAAGKIGYREGEFIQGMQDAYVEHVDGITRIVMYHDATVDYNVISLTGGSYNMRVENSLSGEVQDIEMADISIEEMVWHKYSVDWSEQPTLNFEIYKFGVKVYSTEVQKSRISNNDMYGISGFERAFPFSQLVLGILLGLVAVVLVFRHKRKVKPLDGLLF